MSEQRRVVPDNSVILPAFFHETIAYQGTDFDLSRRAIPIVEAINAGAVVAFAPEVLLAEFLHVVYDKVWPSQGPVALDRLEANRVIDELIEFPIRYIPSAKLAHDAWELMSERRIAPADSWYLACAVHFDAELWLSHRHKDGLAEKAAEVHDKVFVLTERRFGTT